MRRIVLVVMSTVAAVVMLFGYRTSTPRPASTATATVATGSPGIASNTTTTPPAPRASSPGSAVSPSTSSSPSSTPVATPTATPTATAKSETVTGQTEQTRWGPVQVQLTVTGGKVTAITLLQLPSSNGRDAEINDAAVPVLEQETLEAQSAQIDSVSGATYTSEGYISSLQSALDQAGL